LSDLAVAAFLALIAWIALATKHPYVLFPELGALGWVIFSDAGHPWSRSPLPVMVTPLLTGAVGLAVDLGIQSWEYPLSLLILLRRTTRQIQGLDDPERPASGRSAAGAPARFAPGAVPAALCDGF
jgi:hypothetical protein